MKTWMPVPLLAALVSCGGGGNTPAPPVVPRFAYVVDTAGTISSYAIDRNTGQLRHNGYVISPASTAGNVTSPSTAPAMAPPMVVSSPTVLHLIARSGVPTLVAATIGGSTGILTPRTLAWPTIPLDIVGHPSGRFLYVLDAALNIQAAAVDATGNLTAVGTGISMTSLGAVNRIAADPQGGYLIASARGGALPNYIDQVGTLAIDRATGAPTGTWRRLTLPFQPGGVAVHPNGQCGVAIPQLPAPQMASFSISGAGVPSAPVATTTATNFLDVAFNPQGSALLTLDNNSIRAFPVTNTTTCALGTPVGAVTLFGGRNERLSIEPSGRFVYASDSQFCVVSAVAIGASPLSLTSAGAFTSRGGLSGFAPVFTTGSIGVGYLPTFLYSANTGTNDISIFSISASGGTLTPAGSRTSLGTAPFAMAIDPWSRFAYVANRDSNNVAAFTITSTGALNATVAPMPASTRPVALLVDPSGRFLYVALNGSSRVRLYTINQTTGGLTQVSPDFTTAAQPTALAVDPTGTTLYVATIGGVPRVTSFTISQVDGTLGASLTGGSPAVPVGGYTGLGVDPTGMLVFAGDTQSNFINTYPVITSTATIATTSANSRTVGRNPVSIALDPLGRFLFVSSNIDKTLSPFTLDRNASNLTAGSGVVFGITVATLPRSVLVDPAGQFLYVADESGNVLGFTINQTTGALTSPKTFPVTAGGHPFALAIARQPI